MSRYLISPAFSLKAHPGYHKETFKALYDLVILGNHQNINPLYQICRSASRNLDIYTLKGVLYDITILLLRIILFISFGWGSSIITDDNIFCLVFSCRPSSAMNGSVHLPVCLFVTPFSLCSHHRVIMKFSGVNTNADFDAKWAFLDCNSSLNSPMALKPCTKLSVIYRMCPIVFQSHPSNFKVTKDKKINFLPECISRL